MYYEQISDDLPIEAIVARNMGDEDWEGLMDSPILADGCSMKATMEVERDRFEPEPITIKDVYVTRRRF